MNANSDTMKLAALALLGGVLWAFLRGRTGGTAGGLIGESSALDGSAQSTMSPGYVVGDVTSNFSFTTPQGGALDSLAEFFAPEGILDQAREQTAAIDNPGNSAAEIISAVPADAWGLTTSQGTPTPQYYLANQSPTAGKVFGASGWVRQPDGSYYNNITRERLP